MSDLGTTSRDAQPAVAGVPAGSSGTTVVVGAARGIGAGIAERLGRAAWTERIVLADVDGGAVDELAARMPRMRQAAYCASKAGMRQALRVLGMEVAEQGVRINTVSPGATDTPMMRALAGDHPSVEHLAQGSREAMRPRIPDGRVATPEDVAEAVAFLLSAEGSHIVLEDLGL